MAKSNETAIVPIEEWKVITSDRGQRIVNALQANLGDGDFSQFDLERIMPPQGSGAPQFTIPGLEGDEYVSELNGIIVNHHKSRVYYESDDPQKGVPPDCVSDDAVIGFGRDDIDRGIPKLSSGGYSCEACTFAQFDSARRGSGQACKLQRPLYLVMPDAEMPRLFMVTPSALKNFRDYGRRLGMRGLQYHEVVTRIILNPEKSSTKIDYHQADFEFVEEVPEEHLSRISEFSSGIQALAASVPTPALAEATETENVPF